MTTTTSFIKKYKVLEKIGEGSFSEVLKCQDRQNGTLYAAKRLKRVYHNLNEMMESPEVIAMRKISRHPNILYMIESHYDAMSGKVTLVFELMDMSLYDLVKARKGRILTEKRIKLFLYQLLKGLEHLHKHGLFHRDIKPENILLKGETIKLADLGSIRGIYSRPPYTEYISTRWYRSPECLLTTGFYGPKMDVWAIGCVYYELLTLKPLFPGSNEVDQLSKIHTILGTPHARLLAKFRRHSKARNSEYFFPNKGGGSGLSNLLPHVSENGRDLLKLMLVYDPENRSNVRRLLDHRYFHDLREIADSSPQSRDSSGTPINVPNSSWRNPLFLSYITSERRRKSKVSRARRSSKSYEQQDTDYKVPRVVASSPSNRLPPAVTPSTGNEASKQRKQLLNHHHRIWRNNNGAGAAAAANESKTKIQSSNRLPPIHHAGSKINFSRAESLKSLNFPTRIVPLLSQKSYAEMNRSNSRTSFRHKLETPFSNGFLPHIALRSTGKSFHGFPVACSTTTGSAPNQNFNPTSFPSNVGLGRSKLATINEQQALNYLVTRRRVLNKSSPRTKSPAKKIAKHETMSHHQRQNPAKKMKTYMRAKQRASNAIE